MLACAQEQIYNKASSGKMKAKILSGLCQQSAILYEDVAKHSGNLSKVITAIKNNSIMLRWNLNLNPKVEIKKWYTPSDFLFIIV